MKNSIIILATAFLLPRVFVHADEMDHAISARVVAMQEAHNATFHLQRDIQNTGSSNTSSVVKPAEFAKPTVGTAVEPNIVKKVLNEPVVSTQRDTTKQAATNVLVVQQQLKTTVEPAIKVELQKQLQTNLVALNIQKENLRKTLIAETRLEVSKAAKARHH
jgi:hypothetical protein